ncbi:MAG: hypothetical protein CBC48_07300 [bacterium TMED88]|nr:acyl-CoA dehydrogenase [Deltaproteobacteria bacterium]OUV32997.1 MAG: hypothetical protein CBC48_07300 [bacterium TMED88]
MNLGFDEDQELLRSTNRRFLEERHPITALRPQLEADSNFDRAIWREGAELGWGAMLIPEAFDGGSVTAQPLVDLVAIAEELGRVLYPGPFLETNVVADAIATAADENQCKAWLGPIARGECLATLCLTEDGSPDLRSIGIEAVTDGDNLRLDGVARFVAQAHETDLLLVACNTPGGGPALVLVPTSSEGVSLRVSTGIDLTRRVCEVSFRSVVVPAANVLGEPADVEGRLTRIFQLTTVLQAAQSVGASEQLFQMTLQHVKDRVQFGRTIGSFQAIKHRMADLWAELEGARAATWYAALAVADGQPDLDEAVAVAGSFVRENAAFLAGESLQLHGGVGFTWEYDVHLYLRRAQADKLLYGDPSWHREKLCQAVEIVAEGEA